MNDDKQKKSGFNVKWPEGAKLTMDEQSLVEMRKGLEIQYLRMLCAQPGFKFFHSMGAHDFMQGFQTTDGLNFGILHVYWDGDWKHHWLQPDSPEIAEIINRRHSVISAQGRMLVQELFKKQMEKFIQVEVKKQKSQQAGQTMADKLMKKFGNNEDEEFEDQDEKKPILN